MDDGCYGWEEVYEVYGCSSDYLDSEWEMPVLPVTPREPPYEYEVPLVDLVRVPQMTPTLTPSPG